MGFERVSEAGWGLIELVPEAGWGLIEQVSEAGWGLSGCLRLDGVSNIIFI